MCNAAPAGRPRAPSPRRSIARAFPARPPLPWLIPSALSDGAGDQGPAGRAKPGAGGDRSEKSRAAKPELRQDACPRCSCTGEHLWARPCASPRFCTSSALMSLPLRWDGLVAKGSGCSRGVRPGGEQCLGQDGAFQGRGEGLVQRQAGAGK